MRWYLWAWKLCLTINLIQHNASVIRQLFSLKNTYGVLKITTPYFPGGSDSKVSVYNAGDLSSIPGLGRSPGEGNSDPLQYSGLENSMDYSMESQRIGYDWATFIFTFIIFHVQFCVPFLSGVYLFFVPLISLHCTKKVWYRSLLAETQSCSPAIA